MGFFDKINNSNADVSLFKAVLKNSYLYPYLPENQYQHYHLRQRSHNKALIPKTTYLSDRLYHSHAVQELLLAYCYTVLLYCHHPSCLCCLLFWRRSPFINFFIAMYVHRLGLYCILLRVFLISII